MGSIDEVEDLLHEVVEKDRLTEAKAKVPGKYGEITNDWEIHVTLYSLVFDRKDNIYIRI